MPIDQDRRGIKILAAPFGDAALFDQIADLIANHRHRGWIDIGGHATGAAERNQMPHQSVTGHIGGCADKTKLRKFGAYGINLRHKVDDFFPKRAGSESALDRGSGDAGAERFG